MIDRYKTDALTIKKVRPRLQYGSGLVLCFFYIFILCIIVVYVC